ncbi:hypothetical protein ME763_37040 (plasmid) [Streptomyces murinus]|uniref:hypothetical protein n=1 Tax=Streptomyces murinus TaxID=33900 RepID=UPI00117BF432|nr:hypothetical protein [Streptomyces murinus]WDO11337.1 hypothetical protein ME763_37040 [Streptomyces murinus]
MERGAQHQAMAEEHREQVSLLHSVNVGATPGSSGDSSSASKIAVFLTIASLLGLTVPAAFYLAGSKDEPGDKGDFGLPNASPAQGSNASFGEGTEVGVRASSPISHAPQPHTTLTPQRAFEGVGRQARGGKGVPITSEISTYGWPWLASGETFIGLQPLYLRLAQPAEDLGDKDTARGPDRVSKISFHLGVGYVTPESVEVIRDENGAITLEANGSGDWVVMQVAEPGGKPVATFPRKQFGGSDAPGKRKVDIGFPEEGTVIIVAEHGATSYRRDGTTGLRGIPNEEEKVNLDDADGLLKSFSSRKTERPRDSNILKGFIRKYQNQFTVDVDDFMQGEFNKTNREWVRTDEVYAIGARASGLNVRKIHRSGRIFLLNNTQERLSHSPFEEPVSSLDQEIDRKQTEAPASLLYLPARGQAKVRDTDLQMKCPPPLSATGGLLPWMALFANGKLIDVVEMDNEWHSVNIRSLLNEKIFITGAIVTKDSDPRSLPTELKGATLTPYTASEMASHDEGGALGDHIKDTANVTGTLSPLAADPSSGLDTRGIARSFDPVSNVPITIFKNPFKKPPYGPVYQTVYLIMQGAIASGLTAANQLPTENPLGTAAALGSSSAVGVSVAANWQNLISEGSKTTSYVNNAVPVASLAANILSLVNNLNQENPDRTDVGLDLLGIGADTMSLGAIFFPALGPLAVATGVLAALPSVGVMLYRWGHKVQLPEDFLRDMGGRALDLYINMVEEKRIELYDTLEDMGWSLDSIAALWNKKGRALSSEICSNITSEALSKAVENITPKNGFVDWLSAGNRDEIGKQVSKVFYENFQNLTLNDPLTSGYQIKLQLNTEEVESLFGKLAKYISEKIKNMQVPSGGGVGKPIVEISLKDWMLNTPGGREAVSRWITWGKLNGYPNRLPFGSIID